MCVIVLNRKLDAQCGETETDVLANLMTFAGLPHAHRNSASAKLKGALIERDEAAMSEQEVARLTLPDGKEIELPFLKDATGSGFVDVRALFNKCEMRIGARGALNMTCMSCSCCVLTVAGHCHARMQRPLQ